MTASDLEAPAVQPSCGLTRRYRPGRPPWLRFAAVLALAPAIIAGCQVGEHTVTVQASAETEPVPSRGDAADDAAIWVNPSDPAASLIIGTDKKHGLEVYGLDGALRQSLHLGRMNNVDVRDGFVFGGRSAAIVAATDRDRDSIALFAIPPEDPALVDVADGVLATGLRRIYGLCMYAQRATGRMFVFVNDKDGRYQQHELEARPGGRIGTRLVREFRLAGQPEGCAADDELGWLYVGEERAGFHRLAAAPDAPATLVTVDRIGTGRLVADVEGIAIRRQSGGAGFLLVSSQGDDTFAVYRRAPPNEYVGRFRIVDGRVDGVTHTDGLDVTDAVLPPPFDEGLLVVQDDRNTGPDARQDFKLVPWRAVRQALGLDH
jgi:3-phytase